MLSKVEILEIIKTIQNSSVGNKEKHFAEKYKDFKAKYSNLYTMACGGKMDMRMLEYMLDMMEKINTKQTTQHEADIVIGQEVFNKFIDVSKLPKSTTPNNNGPIFNIK
jgi:DNA-binding ferritin-like protein (Dps family)